MKRLTNMIWKIFGSDLRVEEALEKSTGYNISPNVILPIPANSDIPLEVKTDWEPSQQMSCYFSKKHQE